ncbi:4Fe-4S dicluster domain-containing protein [Heliobacterium undosum]|uniref:4Fe-4S dicluster domain-containing protein n=1 Tax=Heliomicrobium undosum TaxID=121734 RepID=A0A845KZP6_9FIRM|nr:nitroreductase family protein [Heliomicrobium undosum]MZP29577.1 4Fe-4S dicluster domain-containing protein [Heliomicrobium undosum]
MDLITVQPEKCVNCGICAKECPTFVLRMGQTGPEAVAPQSCIRCGHCVAVCPNEALDHAKTPLAGQAESGHLSRLSAAEAERFLRSRRSIRNYLNQPVPREELRKLVNVARFAPTAMNLQGLSYLIVDDQAILQEALEIVVRWLEADASLAQRAARYIQPSREEGKDAILRGAPALIMTTADSRHPRARENALFSLAYLELYAPALGLGTCWAGVFESCALSEDSPLLELFHIPKGKKITGAVMVGYPQYRYPRIVDRDRLDVTFFTREG